MPSPTLLRAASALTTPLLPDDFFALIEPLWSTREPRGRVTAVLPETADAATLWLQTPPGWPAHLPGQYVRVGVDVDGRRHWRTYSLTGARRGAIAITVKAIPDAIFGDELRRLARRHPGYALREHHDDTHGLFDVTQLDPALPTWACGPAGLLDALDAHVDELHVERFRPVLVAVEGDGGTVTFARQGVSADADGATPILVAGEEAGALLPSGCRMGICHSCVGALRSGAVRDLRTGETRATEGELVRTCVSAPCGPVELDL